MFKQSTIKTLAQVAAEQATASFTGARVNTLTSATVTTQEGNVFDANETAITRMNNALTACLVANKPDADVIYWSMANTASGVATEITVGELKRAYVAAVENMAAIWLR